MNTHSAKSDFITAFWLLYEKKPIAKITICELCKLAGYNRTTFYVYYENMDALLQDAVNEIFKPIKAKLSNITNLSSLFHSHMIESSFLEIFPKNNDHVQLLFRHQQYYILSDKMKTELLQLLQKQIPVNQFQMVEILLEYQISAVFGVMKYWLQINRRLTEKQFIKIIYDISANGIFSQIEKMMNQEPYF